MKTRITYFCLYAVVLAAMVAALALVPKADLHMALNADHSAFNDVFWRIITCLAEWPLYVLMLWPLIGMWRWNKAEKVKAGWMVGAYAIAEGASALVCQIIKHVWNMPRPVTFFAQIGDPRLQTVLVEGVQMREWFSFPSGHTATFFVFFTMTLLLMTQDQKESLHGKETLFGVSLLVLALAGGFSRIYLSQHFLLDVCVGSVIGLTSALITYLCLKRKIG